MSSHLVHLGDYNGDGISDGDYNAGGDYNTNFMTVVVRFQLIILKKIKYISFRDLSPNRPFQELTK